MTTKFKVDDLQLEELAAFILGIDLDSLADEAEAMKQFTARLTGPEK